MLNIHSDEQSDTAVCRPAGELEAYSVNQLRQALAEMASSPRLVIDLSAVTFVDSAGLGALIGGIRHVRERGGDVAVACSRPVLIRLLHSTGFDRIVYVTDTVADATEALSGEPDRDGSGRVGTGGRRAIHAGLPSLW